MAKLILSFEGAMLKTFLLNKERITIGRRPDNDIQVDNLAVSGAHAVVTTVGNDSVLEDLNSTNGTLVNGQPVQKHLLVNFDVIELGKHRLKFVAEAPSANQYPDFEKTMVMRRPAAGAPVAAVPPAAGHAPPPGAAMQQAGTTQVLAATPDGGHAAAVDAPTTGHAPPAAQPSPAADPGRDAAIKVLSGPAAGRVLDLTKNITTIGKPGMQVAIITRRPVGYFVTHVEGATASLHNDAPLGKAAQPLSEHDTIEIAGTKMIFFYKP